MFYKFHNNTCSSSVYLHTIVYNLVWGQYSTLNQSEDFKLDFSGWTEVKSYARSLPPWPGPTGRDWIIVEVSRRERAEGTLRGCCDWVWVFGGDRWVSNTQIGPTQKDRMDRQPDATWVLRLGQETVRWQASEQKLCPIWQFCLHCNSQSQKPV